MIRFIAVLLLWPQFAPAQVSQFKGWTAVQRELSVRLAPPRTLLPMERYLPAPGLHLLLGTWYTFGSVHTFQNGLPNSLNMLIWQTSLKPFARDIAQECAAPQMRLNNQARAVLQRLCQWPAAEAKSHEVLMQYWLSMMGYNAPESEFIA